MALDFPASPTLNQVYPSPAVPGVPVYTWDGEKWAAVALGNVRYDTVQALTAAQQQQARQNIYAAPFDAMAYGGLQINGAMEVSQELGATGRSTNGYFCDGWAITKAGTSVIFASQANSPGIFPGLPNIINVGPSTAQATMTAGDCVFVMQAIEGYRAARLGYGTANAQPMTISFWSNHNPAGTYSIAIRNAAATRSYVTTYTQVTAGVSQYNTVTVPGDTTGTWAVDNTIGITLSFTLASGTTFIAPAANTWSAGNYIAASGQVNGVATTAGAFHASGVTILPGSEAPSAARSPFVMRPYDQELVTCKRYWQKYSGLIISGYNAATNNIFHSITINPMRANPTMTYSNLSSSSNVNTIVATSSTPNGVGTQVLVTATGFGQTLYDLTLDARL